MNIQISSRWILVVTLLALGLVKQTGRYAAAEPPHDRPNIVFLFTDDQRADSIGYSGNDVIQTPAMDKLAAQGTRFDNCFVTTSICCISRACVLSGQYQRRHGIDGFDTPFSPPALQQTYPAILRRHGYYTGIIGKWGVGTSPENTNQGAAVFDYWQGQPHQTNFWHDADCAFVKFDGKGPPEDGVCDCPPDARGVAGWDIRVGDANMSHPLHLSTQIVPAKVEQFLETRDSEKPFCLSVFFKAPHDPQDYDPRYTQLYADQSMPIPITATPALAAARPEFLRLHQLGNPAGKRWTDDHALLQDHIRNYYRLISGADYAIGKLVETLDKMGLSENTVILFTSDNGSFHGEHGFAGKWLMREPSIRVPGFIYDPRIATAKRPRRTDKMVLNIDYTATILDLAGIPLPEAMQGKSLIGLVNGSQPEWRDEWFYEHEYSHAGAIQPTIGVRGTRWKYTRYVAQDPVYEELFDLENDPDEVHNLAAVTECKPRLEFYRKRCDDWKLRLR